MPRRPGDDRREEIITEAATLFARNGFHGTSMDDLGTAVGMSGPGLYRHFAGKEAILSQMLVDISRRLLAGGQERVRQHQQSRDNLAALVNFHVDFALDNPELIDVQVRDSDAMSTEDQRTVRRLQAQYVGLWVEAIEQVWPHTSSATARAAAHAAFGLINSTPHSARLTRPEMSHLLQVMATAGLEAASGVE